MSDLNGLKLTRSERIIVVALSYIFCAPLIYGNGKRIIHYLRGLSSEARSQIREEDRQRDREEVWIAREQRAQAAQ